MAYIPINLCTLFEAVAIDMDRPQNNAPTPIGGGLCKVSNSVSNDAALNSADGENNPITPIVAITTCSHCGMTSHKTSQHRNIIKTHTHLMAKADELAALPDDYKIAWLKDCIQSGIFGSITYIEQFMFDVVNIFSRRTLKQVAQYLGAKNTKQLTKTNLIDMIIAYYYGLNTPSFTPALRTRYRNTPFQFLETYNLTLCQNIVQGNMRLELFGVDILILEYNETADRETREEQETRLRHTVYIQSIQERPISEENPDKMNQECECPICYEKDIAQNLLITSCNHLYCTTCFERYMMSVASTKTPICSMCRTEITVITRFT